MNAGVVVGGHPSGWSQLDSLSDRGTVLAINFVSRLVPHQFICTHHWEQALAIKERAVPGGELISCNDWPGVDVVWPSHRTVLGVTGGSSTYAVLIACELFDRVEVVGVELDNVWGNYSVYREGMRRAWQMNLYGIQEKLVVPGSWEGWIWAGD